MARTTMKLAAHRDHLKLKLEKKRLQIRVAEDRQRIAELGQKIKAADPRKTSSS